MTGRRAHRTDASAGVVRLGAWLLVAAVALLPLQGIPGAVSQVFGPAHYHVAPAPIDSVLLPLSPDPAAREPGDGPPGIFPPVIPTGVTVLANARVGAGSSDGASEPAQAQADPGAGSPIHASVDAHVHTHPQVHGHPHRRASEHAQATAHAHPHPSARAPLLTAQPEAGAHPAPGRSVPAAGVIDTPQGAQAAPRAAPHSHAGIGQHHHRGPTADVVYVVGDGQQDPPTLRAGTTGLDHCWSLIPGRCGVAGARGRTGLTAVVDRGHARPAAAVLRRPPRSARRLLS